MGERDAKRWSDEAGRTPKGPRRAPGDRVATIVALCALFVSVALIAVPVAVDTLWDPYERGARNSVSRTAHERALDWAETLRAVNEILAPPVADPPPDALEMAARLGRLGSEAIPVVVGMLCGSVATAEFAAGSLDQPIHPAALASRERALFASLRRFHSSDVVAHLRFCSADAAFAERLVIARLLGEVGTLEAQEMLLELLASFPPAELQSEQLSSNVETALASCARAPGALKALAKSVPKLAPALLTHLARAVGRNRGQESAAFLARLLGRSPDLDVVALQELARVSEASTVLLNESSLSELRRLLDHDDPRVVRAAITVLGRLCDPVAFAAIVVRLEDPDRLVASAAHWSLRGMARVDLGLRADPWLVWLGQQESWWNEHYPSLSLTLRSEDSAAVVGALNELSLRPLFKHEIARAIAPLVGDSELGIALIAIAALERIGSTQASPWLIDALRSEDERRARAWRALRVLTGLDLSLDHEAWMNAIP